MSFSVERIRHLYDFEPRYAQLDGFRCHYLDEGAGEPVVLLHGNPSWSFMYRKLIRSLRGRYRVIAPDHIGCGLSDKPQASEYRYQLQQRVTDLEHLLEKLGVRRGITLVMHDWGGPIGMTYASRHPQSVARLVALNTAGFLLPTGKRLHWSLRVCRDSRLGVLLIRGLNLMAWGAGYLGCKRPIPKEIRRAFFGPHDSWKNRVSVLKFVQDIPLSASDPSFGILETTQSNLDRFKRTPLLICWGERDFIFDTAFLDEWQVVQGAVGADDGGLTWVISRQHGQM